MTETLRIPATLWDEMIAHALRERPLEACGLLSGRDGRPVRFYPAANALRSPIRYDIAAADLFRITMAIEEEGAELLAIFHSHPATEAYPSKTDVALAYYPDAYYLIASLADPERPVLRGFRIRQEDASPIGEVVLERV